MGEDQKQSVGQKESLTFVFFIVALLGMVGVTLSLKFGWMNLPEDGLVSLSSNEPEWIVEPNDFGPDEAPEGRSLFDDIFYNDSRKKYEIPWPFEKVLGKIQKEMGETSTAFVTADGSSGLVGVLIPQGRSLQRDAAPFAPGFEGDVTRKQYHRFPRVVAMVNEFVQENPGQFKPNLKDRFYIGYHETGGVIEAITYNDLAGRFEYQTVSGYMEENIDGRGFYVEKGGSIAVEKEARALCLACHQNHTPIFSEEDWRETNINVEVSQKIDRAIPTSAFGVSLHPESQQRHYHGIPINQGLSDLFDEATDRANFFVAFQKLWKEGCEDKSSLEKTLRCRGTLLKLSLAARFMNLSSSDSTNFIYLIQKLGLEEDARSVYLSWAKKWPNGLKVSNPNVPNRDPSVPCEGKKEISEIPPILQGQRQEEELLRVINNHTICAKFEPIKPRAPIAIWSTLESGDQIELLNKVILGGYVLKSKELQEGDVEIAFDGFAQFFTPGDIDHFNESLLKFSRQIVQQELVFDQCSFEGPYQGTYQKENADGTAEILEAQEYIIECQSTDTLTEGSVIQMELNFDQNDFVDAEIYKMKINSPSCKGSVRECLETIRKTRLVTRGRLVDRKFDQATLSAWDRDTDFVARTQSGERIYQFMIDGNMFENGEGENNPFQIRLTLMDDLSLLSRMIDEQTKDAKDSYVQGAFSRRKVLRSLYQALEENISIPFGNEIHGGGSSHSEGDIQSKFTDPGFRELYNLCGNCHKTPNGSASVAPNYLYSPLSDPNAQYSEVLAKVKRCAPRILYKLEMNRVVSSDGSELPQAMPPAFFTGGDKYWYKSEQFRSIRQFVVNLLAESAMTPTEILGFDLGPPDQVSEPRPINNVRSIEKLQTCLR